MTRFARHPEEAPPLVEWRAVFAGGVIGLGALALLSALFAALAFGAEQAWMAGQFEWWIAGAAVFALFLAAYLAGALSGVRGPAAGMFTGLTVWGLGTVTVMAVGLPAAFQVFTVQAPAFAETPATLWTVFFAILIGLGASMIGGLLGGVTRPARPAHYEEPVTRERVIERQPAPIRRDEPRRTGTEN